jgi:hypothetical protein
MAKSTSKTRPTDADVSAFIAAVAPASKRADAETLCRLFEHWSGEAPVMWGPTMVGFGSYHYRYASGTEGDSFPVGFSPRAAAFSLYLMGVSLEPHAAKAEALLSRLGTFSRGKACLYVKRLSDIDLMVLEELVRLSLSALAQNDG